MNIHFGTNPTVLTYMICRLLQYSEGKCAHSLGSCAFDYTRDNVTLVIGGKIEPVLGNPDVLRVFTSPSCERKAHGIDQLPAIITCYSKIITIQAEVEQSIT